MVLYDPCPAGTCYSIVGGALAEPVQVGAEGKSPSRFSWGPGGGWLLESRVEQNFPLPPPPGEPTATTWGPGPLAWTGWNLTNMTTGIIVPIIPQTVRPLTHGSLLSQV